MEGWVPIKALTLHISLNSRTYLHLTPVLLLNRCTISYQAGRSPYYIINQTPCCLFLLCSCFNDAFNNNTIININMRKFKEFQWQITLGCVYLQEQLYHVI